MRSCATLAVAAAFAAALAAGCSAGPEVREQAYHTDREWGQAQMGSWDALVAYPDAPHKGETPQGMEGITSEEVMSVHTKTFAEKPTKATVIELGIK